MIVVVVDSQFYKCSKKGVFPTKHGPQVNARETGGLSRAIHVSSTGKAKVDALLFAAKQL